MKYIMLEGTIAGVKKRTPIIFPDYMVHKLVAERMIMLLEREHNQDNVNAVSAGEIDVHVYACNGSSETLKLATQSIDPEIINTYNYFHGIVTEDECN